MMVAKHGTFGLKMDVTIESTDLGLSLLDPRVNLLLTQTRKEPPGAV